MHSTIRNHTNFLLKRLQTTCYVFDRKISNLIYVVAASGRDAKILAVWEDRAVPLYFLQVTEGSELIPDEGGIERNDLAEVQKAAIDGASALIADAVMRGERDYEGRIDVEDEQGGKLLSVTFACPIRIRIAPPLGGRG